jgi:putative RecB family exonuclease
MKEFRLSPSRIVLYDKCPRKFYYRYVEKILEPATPGTVRGTIFHKVLEDFYKTVDFTTFHNKHWVQISEALRGLVRTFLEMQWKKIGTDYEDVFESEEQSREYLEETKEFLDFYCLKEAYRLYQFFKKNNPEDEWFKANFEREFLPKSTEEYLSADNVHGYVDKTINVFGRGVGVVDYKTSKTSLPHAIDKSHLLQLKVYSYLYKKKTGELPLHASIYYARTGESVFHKVREEDVEEVAEKIGEIRSLKKDRESFQKNVTKLCDYCYYKETCKPHEE